MENEVNLVAETAETTSWIENPVAAVAVQVVMTVAVLATTGYFLRKWTERSIRKSQLESVETN
jgi:hypothetical protein